MLNKIVFEALDRSLRDITSVSEPMGGIPILLCGDFRQILFQRQQFPLRPSFSLTINKAQGQSLRVVGLDLRTSVFTHGMLYVALSRTGKRDNLHILAPNGTTSNVVYREIFD